MKYYVVIYDVENTCLGRTYYTQLHRIFGKKTTANKYAKSVLNASVSEREDDYVTFDATSPFSSIDFTEFDCLGRLFNARGQSEGTAYGVKGDKNAVKAYNKYTSRMNERQNAYYSQKWV